MLMKEYMTMPWTCHFDAHLAIMQQADEKIHNYVKDKSF